MELNVAKEVARLQKLTCSELRDQFATVTGDTTTSKNRKWLIRRIIWRLQANAEGGLSESAIRKNPRASRRRRSSRHNTGFASATGGSCKTYEEGCDRSDIERNPSARNLAHSDLQGRADPRPRDHARFRIRRRTISVAFGRCQAHHWFALERHQVLQTR